MIKSFSIYQAMSVNSAWSSTKISAKNSGTNWAVLEPENLIQPLSLFPFLWGEREGDFDFQTLWDSSASLRIFAGESTIGRSSRWETEIRGDGLLRGEDRKIQRQTVDFVKKVLSELLTHQITPLTLHNGIKTSSFRGAYESALAEFASCIWWWTKLILVFCFGTIESARIALADDCSRWWSRSSLPHFIVLAKSWSLQWSTNSWWHCTKLVSLSRFLSEPLWLIWSLCLPLFLPNSCDSINWRNFGFKFL